MQHTISLRPQVSYRLAGVKIVPAAKSRTSVFSVPQQDESRAHRPNRSPRYQITFAAGVGLVLSVCLHIKMGAVWLTRHLCLTTNLIKKTLLQEVTLERNPDPGRAALSPAACFALLVFSAATCYVCLCPSLLSYRVPCACCLSFQTSQDPPAAPQLAISLRVTLRPSAVNSLSVKSTASSLIRFKDLTLWIYSEDTFEFG